MKPRTVLIALAALAAAVAPAGCATAQPGAAAVVGDVVIPESRIADQLREINELTDQPPTAANAPVAVSLVSTNVLYEVVDQAAQSAGVTIRPASVDQAYSLILRRVGGEQELRSLAAEQGIAPSIVERDLTMQLQLGELAQQIAPGGPPQVQQQSLLAALGGWSAEVGVEVAPKYGQWDPATLQIGPPDEPVSRAAEPQLPEGLAGLPPQ